MNGVLIDSCVLLDLITDDENWAEWSEAILEDYSQTNSLYINSIIYTEISINFDSIEALDSMLLELGIKLIEIPREALFLAGKAFLKYKRSKGTKTSPLPDFYIGAHALVSELDLITRDLRRYKQHFARANLIHP